MAARNGPGLGSLPLASMVGAYRARNMRSTLAHQPRPRRNRTIPGISARGWRGAARLPGSLKLPRDKSGFGGVESLLPAAPLERGSSSFLTSPGAGVAASTKRSCHVGCDLRCPSFSFSHRQGSVSLLPTGVVEGPFRRRLTLHPRAHRHPSWFAHPRAHARCTHSRRSSDGMDIVSRLPYPERRRLNEGSPDVLRAPKDLTS